MAPVVLFVQRHGIIELAVFQELDDDLAWPQLLHIVLPELDDPAVDGILGRGRGIFRSRVLGAGRHVVDPRVVLQIWKRDKERLGCVGVSARCVLFSDSQIQPRRKAVRFVREGQKAGCVRFSGIERRKFISGCVGGECFGQRRPFGGGEVLKRHGVGGKIAREREARVRVNACDIVELKRDGHNGLSVVAVLDREAHVAARIDRARSSCPNGKQRKQAKNAKSRRADASCPVSHGGSSNKVWKYVIKVCRGGRPCPPMRSYEFAGNYRIIG